MNFEEVLKSHKSMCLALGFFYNSDSPNVFPTAAAAAAASPENFTENVNLEPHPRPTKSETQGVGRQLYTSKPARGHGCSRRSENR